MEKIQNYSRNNEHFEQISFPFPCFSLILDIHISLPKYWMNGLVCMRGWISSCC